MKEIIIDTIVLDYLTRDQKKIPSLAFNHIQNSEFVYVCVTSLWELANHVRDGLIPLNENFEVYYNKAFQKLGLTLLDTQWKALNFMATFDYQIIEKPFNKIENDKLISRIKQDIHKDPFDRMIIAHCISMNIPIVSPDSFFPFYENIGLKTIWK